MNEYIGAIDEKLIENCRRADEINSENLKMILTDNAQTEYGRKYGFSQIRDIDEYREKVPVSDYGDLAGYIERMRGGEKDVLTSYPILGYCMTSGTTGGAKYIPVTRKMFERYPRYVSNYKDSIVRSSGKKRIFVNIFRIDMNKASGDEKIFSEILYRYFYEKGSLNVDSYAGGIDLLFVNTKCDIMYAKLWAAFLTEDAVMIEALYMSELVRFLGYLEVNWKRVLSDIRKGEIGEGIDLPDNIKKALLSMPVSEERLREIEDECSKGFERIVPRLWKQAGVVTGVCGRTNRSVLAALTQYCGDLPRYYLTYTASEAFLGAATDMNSFEYILIPESGFLEFMPYGDDSGRTLLPHELEPGELYEPIITGYCGLYRYRIGDVIKVTRFIEKDPVIEFMFRKDLVLNIAGEKLNLDQLENAIMYIRNSGTEIKEYCVGAYLPFGQGHYIAAFCVEDRGISADDLAEMFDRGLSLADCDYADLRKLGAIDKPEVCLMSESGYGRFIIGQKLGTGFGHNKEKNIYPDILSEEKRREWFSYE